MYPPAGHAEEAAALLAMAFVATATATVALLLLPTGIAFFFRDTAFDEMSSAFGLTRRLTRGRLFLTGATRGFTVRL